MNILYTLLVLLASSVLASTAFATGFGPAHAKVERVIDGDTVKMRVAIWIDQELVISVRIAGIDAPEIFRPKCQRERVIAQAAKLFVEDYLSSQNVVLHDVSRDKYGGRVVARIATEKGDLAEALVAANLAVDGKKGNWCG